MLTNTVILYLRDGLPIFILLSLLVSLDHARITHIRLLVRSLASGTLGALVIVNYANNVSHLYDGAGLELLASLINVTLYLSVSCLVVLLYVGLASARVLATVAFSAILLVTSLHGANFLVFLVGYGSQYGAAQPLILGIALGLGISASFSVLLYFFVGWVKSIGIGQAPHIMLILFAAGQLAQSVNLLSQVDIIPHSPILWDTSNIISDSSETGHVLASLYGYEASPSLLQVMVNIAAVLLPISVAWLVKVRYAPASSESNGTNQ
jgi:high-affinity iron transporter